MIIAPNPLYGEPLRQDIPEYTLAYARLGLSIVPVHGIVGGICTCGKDCAVPLPHRSPLRMVTHCQ
jgi:hypothetical protein